MLIDSIAVQLWINLCKLTKTHGPIVSIHYSDIPQINVLEKEGYVISIEEDIGLKIRVNGIIETVDEGVYFCPQGCENA